MRQGPTLLTRSVPGRLIINSTTFNGDGGRTRLNFKFTEKLKSDAHLCWLVIKCRYSILLRSTEYKRLACKPVACAKLVAVSWNSLMPPCFPEDSYVIVQLTW